MTKRNVGLLALLVLTLSGALIAITVNAFGGPERPDPLYNAAVGKASPLVTLKVKTPSGSIAKVVKLGPQFSGGLLSSVAPPAAAPRRSASVPQSASSSNLGQSQGTVGCSGRNAGRDVRVNQDCGFQMQSETSIAFNPIEPSNLIAGYNDFAAGSNLCGAAWSTDGGQHWGSMMTPWHYKLNAPSGELPTTEDPNRNTIYGDPGTNHPYLAASDPGVAFDSRGRAFYSCLLFDVGKVNGDEASGLFVIPSPPGAKGSFYATIANWLNIQKEIPGRQRDYMVVEDNTVRALHDKPLIAADAYAGSPNRDNIYVTWTVILFDAEGKFREEPIYGSMSTDHGVTWSTPEQISGNSAQLCVGGESLDPSLSPSACNFDQGSDPKVLPNGDLAVAYYNQNTPTVNNQELAVHCHPTGSSPAGTAHLNCGEPAKIGDAIEAGQPRCAHLGSFTCIPGPYVRSWDVPRLAVNPSNGHLYAVWQDYRNGEFDIQLSSSTNGGLTWGGTSTVNPDRGLDHFTPAVDIAKRGGVDRVAVTYQRSGRVPNENSTPPGGFQTGQPGVQAEPSDTVLAGGTASATPFRFTVVSPVFPPPDGNQTGFLGDYTGIAIPSGAQAHPIWTDTRNLDPFAPFNGATHDEDVFTTTTHVPKGVATIEPGTIGQSSQGGEESEES
jgi:hypothetical protein